MSLSVEPCLPGINFPALLESAAPAAQVAQVRTPDAEDSDKVSEWLQSSSRANFYHVLDTTPRRLGRAR
eukprot:3823428-Pyramimonas_sp.AAC.2